WGEMPASLIERREKLRGIFAEAPRLIPLAGHRYIPEEPHENGNPVFSVFCCEIIHYGANLLDWVEREEHGFCAKQWPAINEIRFWSRAVRYFATWVRG